MEPFLSCRVLSSWCEDPVECSLGMPFGIFPELSHTQSLSDPIKSRKEKLITAQLWILKVPQAHRMMLRLP